MRLDGYSQSKKWNVVGVQIISQRESKLCGYNDNNLSNQCRSFLKVNSQKAYIAINKKVYREVFDQVQRNSFEPKDTADHVSKKHQKRYSRRGHQPRITSREDP